MGKLCDRGRNWIQIMPGGTVRLCSWTGTDGHIGSLLDNTLPEICHGEKAARLREKLLKQDYSSCHVDDCPYLMTGEIKNFQTELGELPEYPEQLFLAFENNCNYRCISCNTCEMTCGKTQEQIEQEYDVIESRLKEAMPYAKLISANGLGELFCSKRTLRLLSEWKPLAPAEECMVCLETNGSLFDEEHWKQIEGIGKYYLKVSITVMSLDEAIYQRLSGVKYPMKKIVDNLRFVKTLREKNIINYLELATVVQAENFRGLPEMTRRFLEEFGADLVRLRPYANWGAQSEIEEFFMNIRNPMHPWYKEYKKVLEDPIFKHPKVAEQSGGNDAEVGRAVPYEISDLKWRILTYMLQHPDKVLDKIPVGKDCILYGMGNFTTLLIHEMKKRGTAPVCVLDRYKKSGAFEGVPVINLADVQALEGKEECTVIVTPLTDVSNIKKNLESEGFGRDIIIISDLVEDLRVRDRVNYINKL